MRHTLWQCSLFVLLALMLTACARDAVFRTDADGYGYTNTKTGVHYTALDPAFEPLSTSELIGMTEKGARTLTFYAIADLDASLFIADSEGSVYFSGETPPDPAAATPSALLLCERDAVSVVIARFEADTTLPATLLSLWLDGEACELPLGQTPLQTRAVRWLSEDFAGLSFGVLYTRYESGGYLYDMLTKRAVALTPTLTAALDR